MNYNGICFFSTLVHEAQQSDSNNLFVISDIDSFGFIGCETFSTLKNVWRVLMNALTLTQS